MSALHEPIVMLGAKGVNALLNKLLISAYPLLA